MVSKEVVVNNGTGLHARPATLLVKKASSFKSDVSIEFNGKKANVKRIRVHDLRHSHVAHCIELGFSPVAIAERMGHEGINITFNYAHLYPSKQKALADRLNEDRGDVDVIMEKKEAE